MARDIKIEPYDGPAGGWGSARSVTEILTREHALTSGPAVLRVQNKPGGVACVSCAWAKPSEPHLFEFCENGAKATAWENTSLRATPEFFAKHTVTELLGWRDYDLEQTGRLTAPMRWDPATDTYKEVSWESAFEEIGSELKALKAEDVDSVVFYASGRASNESSYMYQLLARQFGNNNLPDSSNMCHESTSVALPETIGMPVGTVWLEDYEHTDCILFFGQNVGSNSPRMLHDLQHCSQRGVPIITFNPLKERGLERFINPQAPTEMLTNSATRISSQYLQVKTGGDIAAIMGVCKALIEADDGAVATGAPRWIDVDFIATHTHGFDEFADSARAASWDTIEAHSGLARADLETVAATYARSKAAMGIYGMGLTQHRAGVDNVKMLVNLLLLRGNIGKKGAGICPVRGHSNVQGQRTVGITEKPELFPLDKLAELYRFEPPRHKGLNTIETCEGVLDGSVKAFVGLGGNFVRAVPETVAMEAAWANLRLTVQVATKLNRSHLVHGRISYVLPCLGRTEEDVQLSGVQAVTTEDSTTFIHASYGRATPASPTLKSEPAIIAGIALAALDHTTVPWADWAGDYRLVRGAIEATLPEQFHDYEERMRTPGGFPRPNTARERKWNTKTGRANFTVPASFKADADVDVHAPDVLQLMTLRSNDQFNTTVYGYDDRFRGVDGTRHVLFMNRADISRLGYADGETVNVMTAIEPEKPRKVAGLRIVAYDIPQGCVAGYYPECNPLIPLSHYAEESFVPAAKAIPVRLGR
jgi:molybdopterin-dependent oxidoreductase alpha subunit